MRFPLPPVMLSATLSTCAFRAYCEDKHIDSELLGSLESGDILVFNRRCSAFGPLGAAICLGAKVGTLSSWDHVGKDICMSSVLFGANGVYRYGDS